MTESSVTSESSAVRVERVSFRYPGGPAVLADETDDLTGSDRETDVGQHIGTAGIAERKTFDSHGG